ncbi:hypothetical protein GGQ82_000979 [Sphingobium olei]
MSMKSLFAFSGDPDGHFIFNYFPPYQAHAR